MLQLLTGARPGEACVLRPCDVSRTGETWEYVPAAHKTEHLGRSRTIIVGPQAQAVLAPYLEGRPPQACCFSPAESVAAFRAARKAARRTPERCGNREGTNRKAAPKVSPGERYTAGSYRHAVHRACGKAGLPRRSPNRLRHARATFLRGRYGIEAARVVLGHSTADTTADPPRNPASDNLTCSPPSARTGRPHSTSRSQSRGPGSSSARHGGAATQGTFEDSPHSCGRRSSGAAARSASDAGMPA